MWLFQLIFAAGIIAILFVISIGVAFIIGDKKYAFIKVVFGVFFGLLATLYFTVVIYNFFTKPIQVDKDDVYGDYIIDRRKYPGENAEWQYHHYRFTITETDSIYFYVTDKNRIVRTYKGPVDISSRGVIVPFIDYPMGFSKYHVLNDNPTLYRNPFSFYYVFKSPLYGNMFFIKGEYK